MESLKAAWGIDDQAFDKVYEALVETHVGVFNEELRVWKTLVDNGNQTINLWPTRKST